MVLIRCQEAIFWEPNQALLELLRNVSTFVWSADKYGKIGASLDEANRESGAQIPPHSFGEHAQSLCAGTSAPSFPSACLQNMLVKSYLGNIILTILPAQRRCGAGGKEVVILYLMMRTGLNLSAPNPSPTLFSNSVGGGGKPHASLITEKRALFPGLGWKKEQLQCWYGTCIHGILKILPCW